MEIPRIETSQLGVDRLTSTFTDKENLNKLLEISLKPFQEVQDALLSLALQKDLSNINGVWLDYYGGIVGEPRRGRGDSAYRTALELKVAINTADGTPEAFRSVVKSYTSSNNVRLCSGWYSWGQVILDGNLNVDSRLHSLVQDVKPLTEYVQILHNEGNRCLLPAWELSYAPAEGLSVVSQGAVDTFSVQLSTGVSDDLYVRGASSNVYDEGTLTSFIPEWEYEDTFQVHTEGSNFELSLNSQGIIDVLAVNSANIKGETPLCWEITENSGSNPYAYMSDLLYKYVNFTLPSDVIS